MALAKVSTTFANSEASAGAIVRCATAAAIASIAAARSTGLRIGGSANGTSRSRCGAMRETEPQCGWVAAKGKLDGFAGQGLGFALQQQLGGEGRPVARSARAAGGVAGTALLKWAPAPHLLFLQKIISSH